MKKLLIGRRLVRNWTQLQFFFFASLSLLLAVQMVTPYDIKLVLCRKLHLFLRKSTTTAATRAAPVDSNNMHQIFQTPLGELTALPQTPQLDSRGPTPKAPTPKKGGGR